MFPDDQNLQIVSKHIFDPAEYLMEKHKQDALRTDFKYSLGKVTYHFSCHTRVQNFGLKMRDLLELVSDTQVNVIERCSGHDGTYGVKQETYDFAIKIGRPAARKISEEKPNHFTGDCVLAGQHLAKLAGKEYSFVHPLSLLRTAYGI